MTISEYNAFFMGLTVAAHRAEAKARETGEKWCVFLWRGDYAIETYRGKDTENRRYVVAVTVEPGKLA